MNSAINPLGTPSQASSLAGNQVNKSMHPQGTTASYGEASLMSPSVGIMHTNTNVAHSHPNQHQFSLNVISTTGHYINQNMGQIPASNHPVANPSSTAAGQGYNPQKNVSNYMGNYEDSPIYQQNQTAPSPVNQGLCASSQPNANTAKTSSENSELEQSDKPQSNGTPEVKSAQKIENTSSFSLTPKEKSVQPAPVPQLSQVQENQQEKTSLVPTPILTQVPQLKGSDTTNPKVQTSIPLATNSKPLPTTCSDAQQPETSSEAIATGNSTLPTCIGNNDKTASTTVDSTVREAELKKKVEENLTPVEQPENLKRNKPTQGDNDAKIDNSESPPVAEPTITNEEKVKTTGKQTSATTESFATKSPTRKVKHQGPKLDESSKTLKEPKISVQKSPSISKAKRQRIRTQPYQSPLPEVELISKISSLTPRTPRSNDEKLIVFYKNEFLAVRNAEGSFYLCQAVQNIYKSSSKIKIRWLSQDKNDKSGEIYTPDFYDLTDFDCILTNLSLNRVDKKTFRLPPSEKDRTQSILNRSLAVEKGEVTSPSLTEEHPDGLDLSLYRDEDQLKKRSAKKRKAVRKPLNLSNAEKEVPMKRSLESPKVRKVSPPVRIPARSTVVKKTQQPLKKTTSQPEIKKSASTSRRASDRGRSKTDSKTSLVVDQKKAKVLAKIGKKTTIPAAKPIQISTKNVKSGTKSAVSSKKASPTKTNLGASIKPSPRNARRSTRK